MSLLRNKEPPAWFAADDYKAITQFSMRDWYLALWAREEQSLAYVLAKQGIGDEEHIDTSEGKEKFWSNYLNTVMFWKPDPGRLENNSYPPLEFSSWESLEDVTDTITKDPKSNIFIIDNHVGWGTELDMRLLLVDPTAPDTELLSRFQTWLQDIRKTDPLPISRRGRGGTNVKITDDHLERWRRYVVPACLDLDFYAEVFGTGQLTHEALCDVLAPTHQGDTKQWGRDARKFANEAIECVRLLGHQVSSGTN